MIHRYYYNYNYLFILLQKVQEPFSKNKVQ